MTAAVIRLAKNQQGRDFIIGDLHGCLSMLGDALRTIGFNTTKDRLFSVGDLVDRGPESKRMLLLLDQPWFFAVMGNHEQLLLEAVTIHGIGGTELLPHFVRNGLGWWLEVGIDQRTKIVGAIEQMPIAIEVPTERGTVGVVHAGVPAGMSWQAFCDALIAGDDQVIQHALWSRTKIQREDTSTVAGIDRLFVGHTPDGLVRRLGNVYYIDTGAVFGLVSDAPGTGLTLANIMCGTLPLAASLPDATRMNIHATAVEDRPFTAFHNDGVLAR